MNFLNILKKCEGNVSQITRDAGVSRQAVYLWQDNRMPRQQVFAKLAGMDKYKDELMKLDYEILRSAIPLGRRASKCQ